MRLYDDEVTCVLIPVERRETLYCDEPVVLVKDNSAMNQIMY